MATAERAHALPIWYTLKVPFGSIQLYLTQKKELALEFVAEMALDQSAARCMITRCLR